MQWKSMQIWRQPPAAEERAHFHSLIQLLHHLTPRFHRLAQWYHHADTTKQWKCMQIW